MAWFAAIPAMFAGGGGAAGGSGMLGMIGKGMNLAGSMSSMAGSLQQGMSANASAQTNADALRANAAVARQSATIAEQEAHKEGKIIEGTQRSGYAKAGVDTSTGTPLAVLGMTVRDKALEGLREKYKWLYQADQLDRQAENLEDMGKASKEGGVFGALTKGLGGAGTFLASLAKKGSNTSIRLG